MTLTDKQKSLVCSTCYASLLNSPIEVQQSSLYSVTIYQINDNGDVERLEEEFEENGNNTVEAFCPWCFERLDGSAEETVMKLLGLK